VYSGCTQLSGNKGNVSQAHLRRHFKSLLNIRLKISTKLGLYSTKAHIDEAFEHHATWRDSRDADLFVER
jgi:hypothetical protein